MPLTRQPAPRERETDPRRIRLQHLRDERGVILFLNCMVAYVAAKSLVAIWALILVGASIGSLPMGEVRTLVVKLVPQVAFGYAVVIGVRLAGPVLFRWLAGRGWWRVWQEREPSRHPAPWFMVPVGLAVFALVATLLLSSGDFGARAARTGLFAGLFLPIVGAPLLTYGLTRRRGDDLFCRRCGYPQPLAPPAVCPECGHDWLSPWGVRIGHRAPVRWAILGGTGATLTGFLLLSVVFVIAD